MEIITCAIIPLHRQLATASLELASYKPSHAQVDARDKMERTVCVRCRYGEFVV